MNNTISKKNLAEAIYKELNCKGADLSECSIIIIVKVLEKFDFTKIEA